MRVVNSCAGSSPVPGTAFKQDVVYWNFLSAGGGIGRHATLRG